MLICNETLLNVIFILLPWAIYFVVIFFHEFSHKIITLHYCKALGYTCKIKWFTISEKKKRIFVPHTESDYYKYLEDRRGEKENQQIIRKIAIVGYITTYACLGIFLFVSIIFISDLKWRIYYIIILSIEIVCAIRGCIKSSDLKNFNNPSDFCYRYKEKYQI